MDDAPSEFPEADHIVDEIILGKRVFVFWPGTGTIVAVIMLHVVAMGSWLGPTYFAAVPWMHQQGWPWEPLLLVALALCMQGIVVPALLLVRGKRSGYPALLMVTRGCLGAVVLSAGAAALSWFRAPLWPYGVSALALTVAYALEHSDSCLVYVTLRRRFAIRLAERTRAKE
jgi:hypothetical protein